MFSWIFRILSILFLLLSYISAHSGELDPFFDDDPYATPAAKYLKDYLKKESNKVYVAHAITINTEDQTTCREIEKSLRSDPKFNDSYTEDLCIYNPENPIISVVQFKEMDGTYYRRSFDSRKIFDSEDNIKNHTRNAGILMMGAMGFLLALPSDFTNWDRTDEETNIFKSYVENIKKGPVVDQDHWFFNYVTHPWAGAIYYGIARHSGYSKWQAFGYSAFMSTFLWEYGFEAFKEVPSIQDLIITPIIGSLFGELFYQLEQTLLDNGGTLFGSRKLGKVGQFILSPGYYASHSINKMFGKRIFVDAQTSFVTGQRPVSLNNPDLGYSNYLGLEFRFHFW